VLRAFYADSAGPEALAASMRSTAASASAMLAELHGFVEEYLADGGPLEMLEERTSSRTFRGRDMHPERLHSVAVALDVTTQLLELVEEFFTTTADEVDDWPSTTAAGLTPSTRARLERIRSRRTDGPRTIGPEPGAAHGRERG
jgi:hypothetical protein